MFHRLERDIQYSGKSDPTWFDMALFKTHERISTTSEDTLINFQLTALAMHIEALTHKCIVPAVATITFNRFPDRDSRRDRKLYLGVCPIRSLTSVNYIQGGTNAAIAMTEGVDFNSKLTGSNPYLIDAWQMPWPDFDLDPHQPQSVIIVAQCGPVDQTQVDKRIQLACYMLAGLVYQNREGANPNCKYEELPGYASVCGILGPLSKVVIG